MNIFSAIIEAIENHNAEKANRRRWQEQREIRELAALEKTAEAISRPDQKAARQ